MEGDGNRLNPFSGSNYFYEIGPLNLRIIRVESTGSPRSSGLVLALEAPSIENLQRNINLRRQTQQFFPSEGPSLEIERLNTQPTAHDIDFFQNSQVTRFGGGMQQEHNYMNIMNAPEFIIREESMMPMRGNLDFLEHGSGTPIPRNGPRFLPSSSRFSLENQSRDHEIGVFIGGGNASSSQAPLRFGPMIRAERQVREPQILPSLASVDNQHRLSSEDLMVFDASMLNGLPNEEEEPEDEYEDMRLDVDNMSYEELLALEEQIGDVSTGLHEDTILPSLRRRIYQPITVGSGEPEPCCVCQEDYVAGDELGELDCGHDYHFNCIKQWLTQKNSCPICKKTALGV